MTTSAAGSTPPVRPGDQAEAAQPAPGERQLRSGFLSRRLIQESELSHTAWWQQKITGYLMAVPFVTAGTIGAVNIERFPGTTMMIAVFVIALFWGAGPALFGTALGTLELDYFLAEPIHEINFTWNSLAQLLPIIIGCLLVSLLTAQRERARRRARTAEQIARRRSEQLIEANRLKDQFLSLASHELKTPIAAIKGYAQLGQRRLAKAHAPAIMAATARESLSKINEQSDRLTGLVNDLLDVSRIQAGKLELRLGECDLAELCRQTVEEQQLSTGRTIGLSLPDGTVSLWADCERMGQVLSNLIGNALKYSAIERPVQVTLTRQAGRAQVQVSDQGVGIPKDELPLIFERFFRARTAREGNQRGLGLGLAICKEIIQRHHGRIWVDSEEGKGSVFTFDLPLHQGTPAEHRPGLGQEIQHSA